MVNDIATCMFLLHSREVHDVRVNSWVLFISYVKCKFDALLFSHILKGNDPAQSSNKSHTID